MKDIVARKAARGDEERGHDPSQLQGAMPAADVSPVPVTAPRISPPTPGRYPHTVGLRLSHNLYMTAENALDGANRVGDYSFTSLPDVIRAALTAYFDGMALTAPPERGGKRRTTIGLDDTLKARYDELPLRKRGEIIERSLRTFLNRGMVANS